MLKQKFEAGLHRNVIKYIQSCIILCSYKDDYNIISFIYLFFLGKIKILATQPVNIDEQYFQQ
jgi:hypothetical protein